MQITARSLVLKIIICIVLITLLIGVLLKWGVPAAAEKVAAQLPENSIAELGNQSQNYVFTLTEKSHLPIQQQQQIRNDYLNMFAGQHSATLIFRQGDRIGANALALPNNTIIVTDELIEMAHSDQEILGVLAHEQGHLVKRHSLQQALSHLGWGVIYIALTGKHTDALNDLPVQFLGASYSRQFEQEADLYALNMMQKNHLQTSHYANFLQRMSDENNETKQLNTQPDFLSSHPTTEKRIQMVRDFEAEQSIPK